MKYIILYILRRRHLNWFCGCLSFVVCSRDGWFVVTAKTRRSKKDFHVVSRRKGSYAVVIVIVNTRLFLLLYSVVVLMSITIIVWSLFLWHSLDEVVNVLSVWPLDWCFCYVWIFLNLTVKCSWFEVDRMLCWFVQTFGSFLPQSALVMIDKFYTCLSLCYVLMNAYVLWSMHSLK